MFTGETLASSESPSAANDDLEVLVQKLEAMGGKAGNKALREALGWTSEPGRYWTARGRAIDLGRIATGRGKGGSVRLSAIDPEEVSAETPAAAVTSEYLKEAHLYPDAMKVIENGWVREANYDAYLIETTAAKGKAATGGKWSRPDISVLAMKAFPYLPSRIFDIVTFEIKPEGVTSVEGVFEALSHQQFASRAYVVFHVPDEAVASRFSELQPHAERILSTALKHGVGVIVAQKIADWDTWDEIVPAARNLPDPEQANRFIATCFSERAREQVIKWHK
jgi:hypothetical protein